MSLFQKIRSIRFYKQVESLPVFKRVPLHICLGLSIAIILDTGVQIFWKMAVEASEKAHNADTLMNLISTFENPLFWLVVTLFLLQLANWLKVLEHADLSYSQPITSLSYISVGVLSAVLLHEKITPLQVAGISFVLVGVWFISKSDHNTLSTIAASDSHSTSGAAQ
ncbi:MAG: EamA family transporter [Cyanobacteria bacterium SZAS-4]|nr:EamA family transporter [Cyanobacteria bacterium SZAS-4]